MKKIVLFVSVLCALSLLAGLAACKGPASPETTVPEESTSAIDDGATAAPAETESETGSAAPSETETESLPEEADETTTMSGPVANEAEFRPGVWWAIDAGIDGYYEICADGTGAFVDQENGLGVGLTYEVFGNKVTFHKAAADVTDTAVVTAVSDTEIDLTWDDGHTEHWNYMSEGTLGGFTFYTNEQLGQMALEYYKAETGNTVGHVAVNADPENPRTVNIQLYDSLGDHNSTAAWYFVDRFTAQGTDMLQNAVDLTAQP